VSRWLARNAVRANYQITHRAGHVVDSTAIEQYFSVLRSQFAGRRGGFGNRECLNRLLMLMMLQQRRSARITDYAHMIREQPLASGVHAGARRQIDDPEGQPSLAGPAWIRARAEAALPPPPIELDGEDIPF
jgi:hypothetical protein